MFVPLASAPLADDGLASRSATAAGVLPILGSASGTAPARQASVTGMLGLNGAARAEVVILASAAGVFGLFGAAAAREETPGPSARAAFPGESRNSVTLLTGALRPVRLVSNQITGNPE